ncbi:MAG: hypothetical protein BWZ03_00530 [bacterium ADurb.BinA186]|nr:MAG: hypothetical protein BWZ03_00530 [bacterium ADurb.BinA186]
MVESINYQIAALVADKPGDKKKIVFDILFFSQKKFLRINRRINDNAVATVIFLNSFSDIMRVCQKIIDAIGSGNIPDSIFVGDLFAKTGEETGIRSGIYLWFPEISGRSMAITDMDSRRLGYYPFCRKSRV